MKGKKKFIVIIIILIAAVFAAIKITGSKNNAKATNTVTAGTVEKKDIVETLSLKAPLEGTESIDVVSKLHYEILSINVKEGDKVTKGQVLATLDTTSLKDEIETLKYQLDLLKIQQSESSQNTENDVALAQIKLEESMESKQRDYEAALEVLKNAEKSYNSTKTLYESGAESKTALDDAEKSYNDAKRAVEGFNVSNGKVVPTDAELEEIEILKDKGSSASTAKNIQIAQKNLEIKMKALEDCQIKSSIDGTVTRVNAKVGRFADEVGDNLPMFVIENIDNLKMNVKVSEYSIGKLEIGQKAEIKADILKGNTAQGVVSRISPTGEEKSGTTERFIPIQIDVTGSDTGLIAGINATADIFVNESKNTLIIPVEALYDNNDGTYAVFKIKDDLTLEKVPVEIGVESILELEVKSDLLNEGDKIVLSPTAELTDGMSVIVNE